MDLRLRVGLNSGQVIAGEIGSGSFGYTAIGEQVGMAQRVESVAPPGGVMLSESTARLVRRAAVLSEAQRVHIKGAADPVTAFLLLRLDSHHDPRSTGATGLIGRRWEVAAPPVRVKLDAIGVVELMELIVDAWLTQPPKKLAKSFLEETG